MALQPHHTMNLMESNTSPHCHIERAIDGDHFHLSSSAQVPQSIVIVPRPLVNNYHKDDIMRLVKVYWTEHLIEEKLLQPTCTPILLRFYSERLMEERYNRAKMEVKLYGDAIARDGLPLIESVNGTFDFYNDDEDIAGAEC